MLNVTAATRPANPTRTQRMSASVAHVIDMARLHLKTGNPGAYARVLAGEHRAQTCRQQRAIEMVIASDGQERLFHAAPCQRLPPGEGGLMMAMQLTVHGANLPVAPDPIRDEMAELGAKLQLISSIEPGFNVVPVTEDGGVLLRRGEVAVFKEQRVHASEFLAGLYVRERQRPVAMSNLPDSPRIIEREVVLARPSSRKGECWEYRTLESRIIRGVRRYTGWEGPIWNYALDHMLIGPVVGIYAPAAISGEC
jgi:hypothetical protein